LAGKPRFQENPINEIKMAAEEETSEVASIAAPAPAVTYSNISDIAFI